MSTAGRPGDPGSGDADETVTRATTFAPSIWPYNADGLPLRARARPRSAMAFLEGWPDGVSGIADDVNDAGAIGGVMAGAAFVHAPGVGAVDLNTRIPPAAGAPFLIEAIAIDTGGDIVALYRDVLRPANGTMRDVTVDARASDDIDPAPACRIVGVFNSQWRGWGDDPSVQITGDLTRRLRASQQGQGRERLYTSAVRCEDYSGNGVNTWVFVGVPKN